MAIASPALATPRREDLGELIVLHLYGTYREMGRQHVELLGPLAREIYDLQRADWSRLISSLGLLGRMFNATLPPFWESVWSGLEGSGMYEEIAGMGEGLGISGAEAFRGVMGVLGSGTTTLVATRSATADGGAIVAKNSDWTDMYGVRRPVVAHYKPTNGDLPHVMATWPLLNCPVMGVNSTGFAIGINFFMADQVLGVGPTQWPWRRALQKATSVREGIRIFRQARNRGISGFFSMADAAGDIALLEVAPLRMAVARPRDDWFAQTNHARTKKMVPHDRGGSPNSYRRRAAMESAVRPHLGRITPDVAAQILRDRSNTPYVNDPAVGSVFSLNSTVVHAATRTLWHSTAKQPQAPYGEMVPFTAGDAPATVAPIAADAGFGGEEFRHLASLVAELRHSVRLFDSGDREEAGALLDRLAEQNDPALQPHRLAWARARIRIALRRWDEAENLLAPLDVDETGFDIRAQVIIARAWVADLTGRRNQALDLYRRALAYLDAYPQYNHAFTVAPMRGWIGAGLNAPQSSHDLPETPHLLNVP